MKKLLLGSIMMLPASMAFAGVVAIGSASSGLSAGDVDKAWKGKGGIQVVENNAKKGEFYDNVLKKDQKYVAKKLKRQVFSGRAKAPVEVGSDAEVIDYVKSNDKAIGYIDESSLTDKVKPLK